MTMTPSRPIRRHPLPNFSLHRVPHEVTLFGRLFNEGTLGRVGLALEEDFLGERPKVLCNQTCDIQSPILC